MNNHSLNQPSLSARSVAIAGHTGDSETVLRALSDPSVAVRVAAASALVRLKIATVAQMRLLLRDPDPSVRRAATTLVHRTPIKNELLAELLSGLEDEKAVAEVSAFSLGEIGDSSRLVIDKLASVALDHEDALCREAAVAALGALGDGLETILAALSDVATVRRRAVIALAPFEGPQVEAALLKATEDRDWQVRQAAEDLSLADELGL